MEIPLKKKYLLTGGAGGGPGQKSAYAKAGWWKYMNETRYAPLDQSKAPPIASQKFPGVPQ